MCRVGDTGAKKTTKRLHSRPRTDALSLPGRVSVSGRPRVEGSRGGGKRERERQGLDSKLSPSSVRDWASWSNGREDSGRRNHGFRDGAP